MGIVLYDTNTETTEAMAYLLFGLWLFAIHRRREKPEKAAGSEKREKKMSRAQLCSTSGKAPIQYIASSLIESSMCIQHLFSTSRAGKEDNHTLDLLKLFRVLEGETI